MTGPAIHPNWATAHANDSTPEPITAVTMCALAVTHVPSWIIKKLKEKKKLKIRIISETNVVSEH